MDWGWRGCIKTQIHPALNPPNTNGTLHNNPAIELQLKRTLVMHIELRLEQLFKQAVRHVEQTIN